MIEILMAKWVEVVAGLLIIGVLGIVIFVMLCYEEYKDADIEDLKKMMPELPKEKKKNEK